MRGFRVGLVVLGLAAIGYGVLRLFDMPAALPRVVLWFVIPAVVHDVLLAPTVVLLAWAGTRVLPSRVRGPAGVALLAVGGLTALVLVALLRPAPRPETLLDRDYGQGYAVAVAVVCGVVLITALLSRANRHRPGARPEGGRLPAPRDRGTNVPPEERPRRQR
jgi:hypothetical protein